MELGRDRLSPASGKLGAGPQRGAGLGRMCRGDLATGWVGSLEYSLSRAGEDWRPSQDERSPLETAVRSWEDARVEKPFESPPPWSLRPAAGGLRLEGRGWTSLILNRWPALVCRCS